MRKDNLKHSHKPVSEVVIDTIYVLGFVTLMLFTISNIWNHAV